jgi:putative transposase
LHPTDPDRRFKATPAPGKTRYRPVHRRAAFHFNPARPYTAPPPADEPPRVDRRLQLLRSMPMPAALWAGGSGRLRARRTGAGPPTGGPCIAAGSCTIATGQPVRLDQIHGAPGAGRCGTFGRQRWRRRNDQRSLQGGGHRGPWRSFEAVEFATLEWVDWFNNRRLLEPIGNIPPAEAEERYYAMLEQPAMAGLKRNGLRQTRGAS